MDSRISGLSISMIHQASDSTSTAGARRPLYDISKEQLEYLLSIGFKWIKVAALLGVSRVTIYRWLQTFDYFQVILAYLCLHRRCMDYGLVNDTQSESMTGTLRHS